MYTVQYVNLVRLVFNWVS